MENSKRARSWKRRRQPREGTYTRAHQPGGQGVRREAESEGHEEKYRAVVDGGDPDDKPVGQRWDLVEPALWGRRHSHSLTAPRCLRTARYGRSVRDPGRARVVSTWQWSKELYKSQGEMRTDAARAVGPLSSTSSVVKATRPSDRQPSGLGKAAGEGGWRNPEGEMSKVVDEEKFHA
jgi:hypothetical protein